MQENSNPKNITDIIRKPIKGVQEGEAPPELIFRHVVERINITQTVFIARGW